MWAPPSPAERVDEAPPPPIPVAQPDLGWVTAPISWEVPAPTSTLVWETERLPVVPVETTSRFPAVSLPRRSRAVVLFVLSVLAAAGAVLTALVPIVRYRVTGDLNSSLTMRANDFASNTLVGFLIAAGLLVVGASAALAGRRVGAGLVAGVGMAASALALWTIAQSLAFVDTLRVGLRESGLGYRLVTTFDLGLWAATAVAALGVVLFVVALGWSRVDGRRRLHPGISVLGGFASLVMVAGPMVPTGGASFADNFTGERPVAAIHFAKAFVYYLTRIDHQAQPPVTFIMRLVSLGLLLLVGLWAFLCGNRWGLAAVFGSSAITVWIWSTAVFTAGHRPFGPVGGNPGSTAFEPHAVTSVGVLMTVLAIVLSAVAFVVTRRD
ncbi:MAG: hypothetical protein RLZZ93_1144, partial [Actinomycetota bacterium]|jgi:hypothetical protein